MAIMAEKSNILFLSNGAFKYYNFFNPLAQLFSADGHNVYAAVDSKYTYSLNRLCEIGFSATFEFGEFFNAHQTDHRLLAKYNDFDLNGALLSDFERAQVYDIWGDAADIDFFDRLKSALLCFFENIFERHSIDTVVYENVSNTFAYFALIVATRFGADYCGLSGSRLPGRFTISGDPLSDDRAEVVFHSIRDGSMKVDADVIFWIRNYITRIESISPDYMSTNGLGRVSLIGRYWKWRRALKIGALARHVFDRRTANFQIGNPLRTYFNLFLRNVRRRLRVTAVSQLYEKAKPGEAFLLYPLHFHPESSTLVLAGAYLDEYEVIRNIAFSLPEGVRLYVKDHASAWGYPPIAFYRRLHRLPNVRLLGPQEPTKKLIKDSNGVITLTSTVGYEALLLKKQVFLYGSVFYEFHCGVTRITNPARLHKILQDSLRSPPIWSDQYNIDFVAAYHNITFPGSLNLMQDKTEAKAHASEIFPHLKKHIAALKRLREISN